MGTRLRQIIVEIVHQGDAAGVSMGQIVDELVRQGYDEAAVELAIWQLMQERRLTPNGFVCRIVKRRNEDGHVHRARTYEFLLVPWAPERDRQLEFELDPGAAPQSDGDRGPTR